jgi:hypothetical protein
MSKIMPVFSSNNESSFTSIAVQPNSLTSQIDSSKMENIIKPANVKLFNLIPINKRESHVNRSPSFSSKAIRFIKADEYTTYDTKFSKTLIMTSILTMIMTAILFIFILVNISKKTTSVYVLDDLLTDEFKEKNKELNTLNTVSKVNQISSIVLGSITFVATVAQFFYVYQHNDFKSKQNVI